MKWIGLTGGIATGKSTATEVIRGLGLTVIDADKISHQLSEIGERGYEKMLAHFGPQILKSDLSIDRKKLGQLVFADHKMKSDLENILHPLIRIEVQLQKKIQQENGDRLCFYDVPLLFEKKLESEFDATVLIWCDHKTQLERLIKRDGLTEFEALARLSHQLLMTDKVKKANFCIDNSGDRADLQRQIQKLIKSLEVE